MVSRLQDIPHHLSIHPALPNLYRDSHLENNFGQDLRGSLSFQLGGNVTKLLEQNALERDPEHSACPKNIAFGSQNFVENDFLCASRGYSPLRKGWFSELSFDHLPLTRPPREHPPRGFRL